MAHRSLIILALALLVAAEARPDFHKHKRQSKTSLGARLVGGSVPTEGRIEVYRYPDGWGTICDDWFEDADAEVACRMLGFTGGEAVGQAAFGEGTDDIVLDNLECLGSEESLWDCDRNEWGEHNCGHHEDAGVRCDASGGGGGGGAGNVQVRLVDGESANEGRVEVFYDGEWGTVCDDWWETPDAEVVCAQLGFSGGEALSFAPFGEGTGPILLDSVECNGDEASIADCSHSDWGVHDCSHYEDAGVRCEAGSSASSTVRLVNGNGPNEGRVEVQYNGEWGTVCDDAWDADDATVVCRSLGYTSGVALEDCEFGEGSGSILLDEVDCSGSESSIEECDHNPWGEHNCSHYEDAGVICS